MSDFKANAPNSIAVGVTPQTPVGSLQRSPGSIAGFNWPTSKGKEERKGEIMGGEVRLPHSKFLDPTLRGVEY